MNGPTRGNGRVRAARLASSAGATMAGQGWRMLMECLAGGPRRSRCPRLARRRCAARGARRSARTPRCASSSTLPIGRFEGIEEPLARIGGTTLRDGRGARAAPPARSTRARSPPVVSAIAKYYSTEAHARVVNDAMDIQRRRGHLPRAAQHRSRACYQARADRHHGRGREHPDAHA